MSVARGKYLSFLDADDFFEPTMLEEAVASLEKTNADITVFQYRIYYENLDLTSKKSLAYLCVMNQKIWFSYMRSLMTKYSPSPRQIPGISSSDTHSFVKIPCSSRRLKNVMMSILFNQRSILQRKLQYSESRWSTIEQEPEKTHRQQHLSALLMHIMRFLQYRIGYL